MKRKIPQLLLFCTFFIILMLIMDGLLVYVLVNLMGIQASLFDLGVCIPEIKTCQLLILLVFLLPNIALLCIVAIFKKISDLSDEEENN